MLVPTPPGSANKLVLRFVVGPAGEAYDAFRGGQVECRGIRILKGLNWEPQTGNLKNTVGI